MWHGSQAYCDGRHSAHLAFGSQLLRMAALGTVYVGRSALLLQQQEGSSQEEDPKLEVWKRKAFFTGSPESR